MSVSSNPEVGTHKVHGRREEDKEEEDPYNTRIERSGCASYHYQLLDCYRDRGEDWRKCQEELKQFKECMINQQRNSKNRHTQIALKGILFYRIQINIYDYNTFSQFINPQCACTRGS